MRGWVQYFTTGWGWECLSCSPSSRDISLVALSIPLVRSCTRELRCDSGTEGVCHREEINLGSRKQLFCSLRADFVSESAETYSFSAAPPAPKDILCQEKTESVQKKPDIAHHSRF